MIDILKITIPALLVLITAYMLISKLLRNEDERRNFELQKGNASILIPIRLRAYERLSLVLERTAPQKIVLTTLEQDMNCFDFQLKLLDNIRQEFSHNVSQQIYVSEELWNAIRTVQESLLQLVNTVASKYDPNENATALAEKIIEIYATAEHTPTEIAMHMLKGEVQSYF